MFRNTLIWTILLALGAGLTIMAAASDAQEARLPTVAEVKAMQAGYQAERQELVKKGFDKRFSPDLMTRAEDLAQRADKALLDGRLFQASEGYREARWLLPYQSKQVPAEHVALVLGNLRLRHDADVTAVAFSPDGRLLASAGKDCTVRIWDLDNGHELVSYTGHGNSVWAVAFSPDGKVIASGASEPDIRLWEPRTGKEVRKIPGSGGHVVALAYTPDGKYLVSGQTGKLIGPNSMLCVHDANSGKLENTIGDFRAKPHSLSFNADGSRLAVGVADGEFRLFEFPPKFAYWAKQEFGHEVRVAISPDNRTLVSCGPGGVKLFNMPQHPKDVQGVSNPRKTLPPEAGYRAKCAIYSKDGKTLAVGCSDGAVRLFDANTLALTEIHVGHGGEVNALCYNATGSLLASAGADHTIRVWQNDVVAQARDYAGHTGPVWKSSFSPDGRRIVSASADHTVRIWDAASAKVLHTLTGHASPVTNALFSPDGKFIASAGGDKLVKIWDADSGKFLRDLAGHTSTITCLDFSSDGKKLVSGGADRMVKIWDYQADKELATISDNDSIPAAVVFSPNGKQIAVGNVDATIKLFDAETGKLQASWSAHGSAVTGLAFSPDGNLLASSGADQTARIWIVARPGTTPITLAGHSGPVSAIAFRKDNQHVATCGSDMLIKLWKLEGGVGKEVQTFRGHKDWVTSVNFSKDGFYIVSSGVDRLVQVSEITTRDVPVVAEQSGTVLAVAVSPDGKLIASAGTDKTIKIWERATGKDLATLFGHAGTVTTVAFTADSKHLVSGGFIGDGSQKGTLKVWDIAAARELQRQPAQHQNWTTLTKRPPYLSVSPDGLKLFVWEPGAEKFTKIAAYNLASGEMLFSFSDVGRAVRAVSFSGDGKTAALAGPDGIVRLFDLGKKGQAFPGGDWFLYDKEGQSNDVALSPDGAFLAAGSTSGELKVCKVAGKEVLYTVPAHNGRIGSCMVSPDGKRIATAGYDNVVKLWDLATGKELRRWSMQTPGESRRSLIMNLAFTPDSRQLLTANANTTVLVLELP